MIALVAAAVVAFTAAGVALERRHADRARRLARGLLNAILYGLFPFIVFFNVVELDVGEGGVAGLALAGAVLALCGAAAWLLARRALALERPAAATIVASVVQANTGILGIPLVAAALGSDAIDAAIAYDTFVTGPALLLVAFGLGAAFGTRAGSSRRQRLWSFVSRNPPLLAVAAALLVPDSWAWPPLVDIAEAAVFALVPIGFLAVGITLGGEARAQGLRSPLPPLRPPVALAVGLRLLVAPALLVTAASLLTIPDAYLLQIAAPCGVNGLVVAHAFGLDLRLAAGAIAWSTAIVLAVAVPLSLLL